MHAARDTRGRAGGQCFWGQRLLKSAMMAGLAAICLVFPNSIDANGERTIALYNVHTKDTLRIVYKRNGSYLPDAMKQLNWHLRDWRRDEPTRMDPKLIDLVWEIHNELGSRVPVHVISGYRSPKTNNMLRKTRGGQARRSQHLLGRAVDVRFPDIPVRRLRYSALLREQGGVGYYPTSATPFVHLDTGRVRHWPRMGRQELALLFPNGRTRHRPRRGGPITRRDALIARKNRPTLAGRVALFHQQRRAGPAGSARMTRVAAAASRRAVPAPKLVQGPRPMQAPRPAAQRVAVLRFWPKPRVASSPTVARAQSVGALKATPRAAPRERTVAPPMHLAKLPAAMRDGGPKPAPFQRAAYAAADRAGLQRLAGALFGPSLRSTAREPVAEPKPDDWISAPAYDEEHPEELFYRPFPIAPYITLTASADDRALRNMRAPSIDQTLMLLVEDGVDADPPLQLRPGMRTANMMWSLSFSDRPIAAGPKPGRLVPTQQQVGSWLGRQWVRLAGR